MVINIGESSKIRKIRIDEQIKQRIVEEYCDEDERGDESAIEFVQKNPLIRLFVKFDFLDSAAQHELLGYAKGRILGISGDLQIKDLFNAILKKGKRNDWDDIEEFADELLMK